MTQIVIYKYILSVGTGCGCNSAFQLHLAAARSKLQFFYGSIIKCPVKIGNFVSGLIPLSQFGHIETGRQ